MVIGSTPTRLVEAGGTQPQVLGTGGDIEAIWVLIWCTNMPSPNCNLPGPNIHVISTLMWVNLFVYWRMTSGHMLCCRGRPVTISILLFTSHFEPDLPYSSKRFQRRKSILLKIFFSNVIYMSYICHIYKSLANHYPAQHSQQTPIEIRSN